MEADKFASLAGPPSNGTASSPDPAAARRSGGACLEGVNIECRRGGRLLFSGFDFRLDAGAILQIEGANGCGKTSLLRILSGLMRASAGWVHWCGADIVEIRAEFHRNTSYVGHSPGIKDYLTPRENLAFTAGVTVRRSDQALNEALERVGLLGFEDVPARILSAGQRRRVALGRLLVSTAQLWLLDEPFAALDKSGKAMVEGLLGQHAGNGGMAVVTTHQAIDVACRVETRTLAMAGST